MADVILVESTYGDRLHPPDPIGELERIINEAVHRGGPLVVPAFAVGRTQELLWFIRQLETQGRIPELPVYIDSPMATEVTELYCHHTGEHNLPLEANSGRARLRHPDRPAGDDPHGGRVQGTEPARTGHLS